MTVWPADDCPVRLLPTGAGAWPSCRRSPAKRRTVAGLTLVELLVSIAIGLFLVAVGATLLVAQLKENRSLLVEARLMQDLRTAADLMTRDLRRDGYWGAAEAGTWTHGASLALRANPYQTAAPASAASDATLLRYSRDDVENNLVDGNEEFGYRLRAGVIDLQLGADNWQALTDAGTMTVIGLAFAPRTEDIPLADACASACPAVSHGEVCPPHQSVRSLAVTITARAAADPAIVRSLRSQARVRNDAVVGACPRG